MFTTALRPTIFIICIDTEILENQCKKLIRQITQQGWECIKANPKYKEKKKFYQQTQ